jgi:hypothetical protein
LRTITPFSTKREYLALRASNANQVIYGANSSVDDDVKYNKDSVEEREVPLISELNTHIRLLMAMVELVELLITTY